MKTGVVLYGAPATGKDTITKALQALGPFAHFERLKCGPGRTAGYRMISAAELADVLAKHDEVVWRDDRYGSTYLVDRSHVHQLVNAGRVPVIHLGKPQAVDAVTRALASIRWLVVELHSARDVALERIVARSTGDTSARLEAYDSTPRLEAADLSIDTGRVDVDTSARTIAEAVRHVMSASLH